jgi:ketosteroid isomerase-like protein
MSKQNVEIVRRTITLFAQEGTGGSFEGLLADDFEFQPAFEVAGGERFVGPGAFMSFMGQWTEAFDAWEFEVVELLDAGDEVAARMRQRGKGRASGAPVDLAFGAVFSLRDQRIARMALYTTQQEALKAVGLEA